MHLFLLLLLPYVTCKNIRNMPLLSIPEASCKSGYARQHSFDPTTNKPICLTNAEVQNTTPGGPPAETIPICVTKLHLALY